MSLCMIISHRYGFIFLKTRKTAGTSIELVLRQLLGPSDIATPLSKQEEKLAQSNGVPGPKNYLRILRDVRMRRFPKRVFTLKRDIVRGRTDPVKRVVCPYRQHMNARLVRDKVGTEMWGDYFVFCVERNPWDSSVSHYYYFYRASDTKPSFDFFVESGLNCVEENNYDVYSIRGIPSADLVIDYDDLNNRLDFVSDKLCLPASVGELLPSVRAKSYRSKRAPYQSYYTTRTKRLVELQFAREIAYMGYTFDGGR